MIKASEKVEGDPKAKDFVIEVTGSVGDAKEIKQADWNDYKIVAKGNHLQHYSNGRLTVEVTDEDDAHAAKEGLLALQVHTGPAMVVQFKDLVLKTE